jgi:hypothetical protein
VVVADHRRRVGIIMANRKIRETDAFALLVRTSQHTNRKVRTLPTEIVETGDVSQLLAI